MDQSETTDRWVHRLVEAFEGKLCRYAARFTRDEDLARDAVQDTFLRLCRETKRFDGSNHVSRWLFKVCRSRALDRVRKEKRMSSVTTDAFDQAPAATDAPGAVLERNEQQSHLMNAVSALPDQQQEAIRLKFQEDMSYKDIAEVMDITPNHVGVLIHGAMKALRKGMV